MIENQQKYMFLKEEKKENDTCVWMALKRGLFGF